METKGLDNFMTKFFVLCSIASLTLCAAALTFAQGKAVNMPDRNLRAAIEEALGKNAGEQITEAEMIWINSLNLSGRNIHSLTGLEKATNLKTLMLESNEVADISALAELTKLTELRLTKNRIVDISPLTGLQNLRLLVLESNEVADISALAALTNLTALGLGNNAIVDISAVSQLTKLEVLHLADNAIEDISALATLTNLTGLYLYRNAIENISALGALTNLTTLLLWENRISDISALAELTALSWLELDGNAITDISAVSGLTELSRLELDGNAIADISPLVENTGVGAGDEVLLANNPLNYAAIYTHIPVLQARGVANLTFTFRIPTTLLKVAGDNQQAIPGETLPQALVVEIKDGGTPAQAFEGVPVRFVVASGGGSLSATTAIADAKGRAEVTLTLGTNPGLNEVLVTVDGIPQPLRFTATARPARRAEDVNGDGVINIQDLVLVSAQFGKTGKNSADVNGDGVVNIRDLVLVAGAFGD